MLGTRTVLLSLLALAAPGCLQTTTMALAPPSPEAAMRVARAVEAWSCVDGEHVLGSVVLFRDGEGDSFYSVRNEFEQELGVIDANGIAYRYRPHAEEAERVATGAIADGASAILGVDDVRLEDVDLSSVRDASRCSGTWGATFPDEEEPDADGDLDEAPAAP